MTTELESNIVRILHSNGSTVGTGFVVESDLIVTCAHVIEAAGSAPGQPVKVRFFASGIEQTAQVLAEGWSPVELDDVAILQVDHLPDGVIPAILGTAIHSVNHHFSTLGFPLFEPYEARSASGRLGALIPVSTPNRRPLLQMQGDEIARGMSGAPVLDLTLGRVVGMISEYKDDERERSDYATTAGTMLGSVPVPRIRFAYATTADTLAKLYPRLRLRYPQPIEDYLTALAQFCDELPYVSLRSERHLTAVYVRQRIHQKLRDFHEIDGKEQATRREAESRRARSRPIEEALVLHPRLIVVGGPGAGKSTLLRHLVEEQLTQTDPADDKKRFTLRAASAHLPILVSLRGLAEQQGDLQTCLRKQIEVELGKRLPTSLPEDFLLDWSWQTDAAWLIALDGLDEIINADRRDMLLHELGQIPWPPNSRVVLSTRPSEAVGVSNGFTLFDLLPFEPQQLDQFARSWFASNETLAKAFLQNIRASQLSDLLGSPLLLTVAATVFEEAIKGTTISETDALVGLRRSTLYERFIDVLLAEDAVSSRQIREQFLKQFRTDLGEKLFDYRREMLEHIALHTLEGWSAITVLPEFLQKAPLNWNIHDVEKKAGDVLDILARQRTGLLVRRGSDYEFIHPTFREYLSAAAIVRMYGFDLNILWKEVIDDLWDMPGYHDIILFVLAILSDHDHDLSMPIKWISERGADGLAFAGMALADGIKVASSLGNTLIAKLLVDARENFLSARPLEVLARLRGWPRVAKGLLELARDTDTVDERRQEAAESLEVLGAFDEAAQAWLILVEDKYIDASMCREAIAALERLKCAKNRDCSTFTDTFMGLPS